MKNKCAVFILLGQSNAAGHGVPMKEEDIVTLPMKNVFGLSRAMHQSLDNTALAWQGYTTAGMNLAEECDNSYSVANCLAKRWQAAMSFTFLMPPRPSWIFPPYIWKMSFLPPATVR